MSALDRLNQFEDAVERGFSEGKSETTETKTSDAVDQATSSPQPESDSDEAILAELEAEEAAAREAASNVAEAVEPPSLPVEEVRADQGGELDIF
jgi:hypothetical protein